MPSSSSTTSTVVGGLCGSGLGMALTYVPSTTRASRAMLRPPMASSAPAGLTTVRGISVGHWTDLERATGCSVVLGPESGMRAACAVRGRATGTRELDALNPRHVVDRIDAVLLTGGSAFGLGAADGVMRWLKERGRGLPVGSAGIVPIVPTAVIFDFAVAPGGKAARGRRANAASRAGTAASAEVVEGSVGAGTGATVGKALGPRAAMKGGVGSWAASGGDIVVGALVVLNAVGNILDGAGAVLAGARAADGTFADALTHFARGGAPFGAVGKGRNTTLAVVATNATLDRIALEALAHAAGDALARRIVPYGTLFDGDVVFAVSTATAAPATPLQTEALAALAVPMAVERAVRLARGLPDIPGLADKGGPGPSGSTPMSRVSRARGGLIPGPGCARGRWVPRLDSRRVSGRGFDCMGGGLDHASHRALARGRGQVRGSASPARGGGARRAAPQRAGRDCGRTGGECERRCRPTGIGAPSGGAAPRTAGVGAALVLGRALSVGRAHRVGHRLLRPSPGNLRGPGDRATARLGPAVARGPGGEDRRRGLGLRGGRSVVLRGRAPGFPCRPLGGGGSDRAFRAGARRRRIGRPARRDARREAAAC